MPLKKGMLPSMNAVKKAQDKKAPAPPEQEVDDTDINGMKYHRTFLPKTEMGADGRPVNNIEGIDDMNLSLSMSSILKKDLDKMKKDRSELN